MIICGIITEPIEAVSATEEPEMQPNIVEARMLTSARPPRMNPTNTLARLMMRVRHAAFGHDPAGEDEERNREQREIVHAVGRLEHDRFERQADPQRREDRGKAERIGDRHAEQAEDAESAEENEHVHGGLLGADLRDGVVGRAVEQIRDP